MHHQLLNKAFYQGKIYNFLPYTRANKWTQIHSIQKKRELGLTSDYLTQNHICLLTDLVLTKITSYDMTDQKLCLAKPKTTFLERSFFYRGAVSLNQILMEKLPLTEKYLKLLSFLNESITHVLKPKGLVVK